MLDFVFEAPYFLVVGITFVEAAVAGRKRQDYELKIKEFDFHLHFLPRKVTNI